MAGALADFLFLGIGSLFGLILGAIGGVFFGEYLRRRQVDNDSYAYPQVLGMRRTSCGAYRAPTEDEVWNVGLISWAVQGTLGVLSIAVFVLALIY